MLLIAVGGGLGFLPLILIATGEATPQDSGLVSGLVSTSQMVGGAIGLAVLVSLAAARTGGATDPAALNDGYHVAFLAAAALTVAGLVLAARLPDRILPA
jgi:MFS family permease